VSEQSAKLSAGFNAKLFIIKILNLSQVNKCDVIYQLLSFS